MPQIKITLTEEEIESLKKRASHNLNSISKEARVLLHHALYNSNSYNYVSDPLANTIDIKPGIISSPLPDYSTSSTPAPSSVAPVAPVVKSTPKHIIDYDAPAHTSPTASTATPKNIITSSKDLEAEQVDNEWDAEGNEYSTSDFLYDLKNLESKMREDLPADMDPTRDPDYVTLKNYFIKHDLRERFRSLLSNPSSFYPEEGVYEQPQIRYAQAAFKKEKLDEDYVVALLSGTGADYRQKNKSRLYTDEI